MIIKSLQDINNIKTMVRVMDNTYAPEEETKEMIGFDFEASYPCNSGAIAVYNKDKSTYYGFNKKDLQTLTPIEYKGRLVGRGDMVLYNGRWCEVFGYEWYNDEFRLSCAVEKNYSDCVYLFQEDIQDISPLYTPKPEEIITVGKYRYKLIQE